jgi:hypothetical protein
MCQRCVSASAALHDRLKPYKTSPNFITAVVVTAGRQLLVRGCARSGERESAPLPSSPAHACHAVATLVPTYSLVFQNNDKPTQVS